MVENMFFLDNEQVGMGDTPPQNLLFQLSGREFLPNYPLKYIPVGQYETFQDVSSRI